MIGRTIRPRPLSYTERIPVIFLNRRADADDDSQHIDPALEQFLKTCEDERAQNGLLSGLETSRRRRKNCQHRAAQQREPPPLPPSQSQAAGEAAISGSLLASDPHQQGQHQQPAEGATGAAAVPVIVVPTWQDVPDYGSNEEAMAKADARKAVEAGPSVPLVGLLQGVSPCLTTQSNLALDAAAYIIYQDIVRDQRAVPALLQYDMDDEDDKALAAINAPRALKPGAMGASRTPPTTRAATAAAAAAAAAVLDEDGFEALMGVLERAHFEALQQRKELWQAEVKAGKVPNLPSTDKILPWDAALAALKQHQPPLPPLPRALYTHWLKRRKQEGGPLLQCLWYEQPWKAICFRDREPGHEGEQGDMPFMATETKNGTRGGWNRIRIDKKEAYELLLEVRDEFELLRTTADQVRKRERLKKQLLKLYRAEMAAKLGLTLHSKHAAAAAAAAAASAGTAAGGRALGGGSAVAVASAERPQTAAAEAPAAASGRVATVAAPAAIPEPARGRNGEPPPAKRRRVTAAAAPATAVAGRKAATKAAAEAMAAPPTGLAAEAEAKTRRDPPKSRQAGAAAPCTARAGRRVDSGHGKPAAPSPTSLSSSTLSSSANSSLTSSDPGDAGASDSGAQEATGIAPPGTDRGRRPPASAQASGRFGLRSAAAEPPRPGAQKASRARVAVAAAAKREKDRPAFSGSSSSSVQEEQEEESGSGSDDDVDDSSSLPPQSTSASSSSSSSGSESDGSSGSGSGSGADSSGDEGEAAQAVVPSAPSFEGAGQSRPARRQSRNQSRARNVGRGAAAGRGDRAGDGSGSGSGSEQPEDYVREQAAAAPVCGREGGGTRGRQGAEAPQRKGPSGRDLREDLAAQQQRPRGHVQTRSRWASRPAEAAPPASPATSPAPSSSTTSRSSSPSRSGRERQHPSSSSPEPSRSGSRSPPPRRDRRRSAPAVSSAAASGKRRDGATALEARRRRLTGAVVGSDRQAVRHKARIPGKPTEPKLGAGGASVAGGVSRAQRPNRELRALLRMQGGSSAGINAAGAAAAAVGDASAAGHAQPATAAIYKSKRTDAAGGRPPSAVGQEVSAGAAAAAAYTVKPVSPAAPGRRAEVGGMPLRSTSGGGGTAPAPLSPLAGSKRPLEEPHGAQAGASNPDGGSPSPSHKKSNLGWRKELAALLGKPFAMTSRFLLKRKQHLPPRIAVTAAGAERQSGKAREGRSSGGGNTVDIDPTRGSARRTSMLRERNGTAL